MKTWDVVGSVTDLKEVSTSHDLLADWYLHDDLEVIMS